MSFGTCPIATVDIPVERVWRLLADPRLYDRWWDAQTDSIVPEGPAQPGQEIFAHAVAFGRQWKVHITVQAVSPEKHQLDYLSRLPLGLTGQNHLTCLRLDDQHTRVSFG
jgi:hypothetical protein